MKCEMTPASTIFSCLGESFFLCGGGDERFSRLQFFLPCDKLLEGLAGDRHQIFALGEFFRNGEGCHELTIAHSALLADSSTSSGQARAQDDRSIPVAALTTGTPTMAVRISLNYKATDDPSSQDCHSESLP